MGRPNNSIRLDPRDYNGQCRGKRKYGSKKQALGFLRVARSRNDWGVTSRLGAYKCKMCRGWHLGNSKER